MELQKFLPGQLVIATYPNSINSYAFFIVGEPEFGLTQLMYSDGKRWFAESILKSI